VDILVINLYRISIRALRIYSYRYKPGILCMPTTLTQ